MSWYIEEQEPVYLDYNATTPLDPSVKAAITEGLDLWANPSSQNPIAEKAREAIKSAKRSLGELLHVTDAEVIFTSGGTETNNWVIHSAIQSFKSNPEHSTTIPHIITSTIEHPSVIEPLRHLRDIGSIELSLLPVDPSSGQIVPSEVEKLVSPSTCLVTVQLANNETGVLQPIAELSDAVRQASKKHETTIFLHSDVSQAIGKIDVNIGELKVDAVTVAGHKFYGPRSGALIMRSQYTTNLIPLLRGGGQQQNLRSGTENTPMIMGMGAAAAICETSKTKAKLSSIRDYFEQQLKELIPDEHVVHFSSSPRLPNTSSVAFPKYPNTNTDMMAKCKTFYASTGAACHSGSVSPILLACGVSKKLAERTIRFSFGRETSREDMNSEMTSAENAEESVGIDTAMEHSESVPQALNNWDDIGDQVRSMERGLAPDAAGNPYTAPTAGAERVAKYDRWASLNPNSQVVKIVSSILTGIFPRIDQCTVTSSSTNVRNIDWTCPGEIVVNGQHVACTANAPINSPLPFAPLLSTLTFRSPYDFARLIAIMTQSHIPEHFRVARMLDSSYDTVTIKSIGFAISFYRAHCIHMTLATVADARGVTQGYLPRSKSDPYNLPNMYVDAVKFANENPWTEMSWRLVKPRRTLIVLPEGFQGVLDCFESPLMTAKLAIEPDDIQAAWFEEEEWSAIMLFSPARYVVASRWMNAWFLLVQAVAKGAELYVLPGPKDDRSWGITVDLLRDFAEETVVQRPPLKQRIHCLLPLKSEEHVCDAPFKILADKMNLATGPYFTQSAAKRFWTATRKHYSSMIRLPECQRVPEPKRRFGDRAPQQAAAHSSRDHRFNRPLNSGPPKQQRNRSFSRPPVFAERQNFERRSLRGKKLGRGGRF